MPELSRSPLFVLHLSVLTAAACGGGGSGGTAGGLDGPDVPLIPTVTDLYTVGVLEGDDWEVFGEVASVRFDEEGRLYILDSRASRISVVGPDGDFIRSIGGPGGGPGELQMPFGWAVLPGGGVAVFDLGKRGFEVFGPDGAYENSVPVDMAHGGPGRVIEVLPDGRLLSASGILLRMEDEEGREEEGRPLHVFDLETGDREVRFRAWEAPPPPEGEMRVLEGEGGRMSFTATATRAYEAELHFAARSDGTVAVVDSTGYRVKLIDSRGVVTSTIQRPLPPLPVTDALREAERERRLAALQGQGSPTLRVIGGGGGGMRVDEEQFAEMMRDQIDGMIFPDVIPVISAMAVDGSDRIWLRRHGPTGEVEGAIDVIAPGPEYLGTIEADFPLPDAFGPDGLAAYIETDDLGVQRVRVARVELAAG